VNAATISDCGTYRYDLHRWINPGKDDHRLMFLMLNPSTADADRDDPTIRRCIRFARDWGFDRLVVTNLFALRATDPAELLKAPDPIGPGNDESIYRHAAKVDLVVAAWGAHPFAEDRADSVATVLHEHDVDLACLGTTLGGHPRHPLYIAAATKPVDLALGFERLVPATSTPTSTEGDQ
jgi:hypothetical protein